MSTPQPFQHYKDEEQEYDELLGGDGAATESAPEADPVATEAPKRRVRDGKAAAARAAAEDAPEATDSEDELLFSVRMEPQVLALALREAKSLSPGTEMYVIAAASDAESDLYKGDFRSSAIGTGRLLVGLQGTSEKEGSFVEVPVTSVAFPGFFLTNDAKRLEAWASACTEEIEITASRLASDMTIDLKLTHGTRETMHQKVFLLYEDDSADIHFPLLTNRAEAPETEIPLGVVSLLTGVSSLATTKDRVADLSFYPESDEADSFAGGSAFAEVVTYDRPGSCFVATVRKQRLGEAAFEELFMLELPAVGAALLETAAKAGGGVYSYDNGILSVIYRKSVSRSDAREVVVERHVFVSSNGTPLKSWMQGVGDEALLSNEDSRHFATVGTAPLLAAAKRVWALDDRTSLTLTCGDGVLNMATGEARDTIEVAARTGDSDLESLKLASVMRPAFEMLAAMAPLVQLRTFPDDQGGELPNVMLAIPLPAEEAESDRFAGTPAYAVFSWN